MELRVYLSYAPEDIEHRDVLMRHLDPLRRAGKLRLWHRGAVFAGGEIDVEARAELDRAALVLLLVSADYLASNDCRAEMDRALERARANKPTDPDAVRVVPVLLRPCLVGVDRIAKLAALPANGRPVTVWPHRESAWHDIAIAIAALAGGAAVEPAASAALERAEVERLSLLAKLEDAHVRKRRLTAARGATSDVDAEILRLKRELREGGQVQQGDLLSGRYTLLQRIGRGGFATVWEAEDRESPKAQDGESPKADEGEKHTRVAIKILHPDLAGDTTRRERFFRGARIMGELRHEAIVRILATEQQDMGFHFFVMEHMSGGDLHHAVLEGRIAPDRIVPLILRIGEALIAAHERRFIHRDVKPANILLGAAGEPKLGDFDLVGGKETTGGTRTGAMGSFVYAAPEMLSRPQEADQRADVFGLGMTALFCLHGKPLTDEAFFDPKSVLEETGRPALAAVIAKAIERKPAARFADVRSFCAAWQAAAASERAPSQPPRGDTGLSLTNPLAVALVTVRDATAPREQGALVFEPPAPVATIPQLAPPAAVVPPPVELATPETAQAPASARRWPRTAALAVASGLVVVGAGALGVSKGWLGGAGAHGTAEGSTTMPSASASLGTDASASVPSASASSVPSSAPAPAGKCPEGMAYLAAGTFRMGSEPGDPDAYEDEKKPHEVTLSAFCLDVTEVTVAAYRACTKEARTGQKCAPAPVEVRWEGADVKLWSQFCNGDRRDRDNHPINCVDWTMADTYCKWAGGALPTEAQWEYAAGGSQGRKYPWGKEAPGPELLNACGGECRALGKTLKQTWAVMYEGDDGAGATAPVKTYPKGATPEGVHDLAGNVWEWVQDRYADYDPSLSADPVQTKGTLRVLRGGGWYYISPRGARASDRLGVAGGYRGHDVGFRCARGSNP